jgi:hypothetical protein
MFWFRWRPWMSLHVCFVVLCETAGQDGDGADRTAHTGKLAAGVGPLPSAFMVVALRLNDPRTRYAVKPLRYRRAQIAFVMCRR